ncbi:MAG: 50S ribosomal protein L17 [candidate division WS2 bacterium]|nr:50S ribosomal protein L17 [Candidatus Lithacetigena glycinireducens]MBT9174405.1 50S ribosomal protein L17 [Candidatus Lithacetigena glycinireducens]
MRHKIGQRKLGRPTQHRLSLLRSLVTSLILYGKISSTEAKIKEVQKVVPKVVRLAKKNDLASIRYLDSYLYSKDALYKLIKELAPKYSDRPGGYTRTLPLSPRKGDGASMVLLEWV